MGPIRVLYGQKSLYEAQVGPKWDKCPESAHMVPIYTCLLVKVYQYGTYIGLIWAKKAYMGPMQDPNGINAQILSIWVPYIHVCWVDTFILDCSLSTVIFLVYKWQHGWNKFWDCRFANDCVCCRQTDSIEEKSPPKEYWSTGQIGQGMGYEISACEM